MGHIQMLGKTDGEILKGDAPKFVPKFILDAMARHAIDFWLTSEDLPDPNNRLTHQQTRPNFACSIHLIIWKAINA